MIHTTRLLLVPASEAHLRAALDSPTALAESLHMRVPADWPPELYDDDAVRYSLGALEASPDHQGWTFYYVARAGAADTPPMLIGAGGFKGPPDASGEVELGYAIVGSQRRLGYATEATRAWCDFAFAHPAVTVVVGQTIPELVGSMGVLEKAGFVFAGEGSDPHAPEGERVLRYELTRQQYDSSR